ncbi:hypothetical protein C3Y89_15845 [Rhizobium sp. UPM1132]|nr:hypothetical protein [Rhizobium ruizarguesonis]
MIWCITSKIDSDFRGYALTAETEFIWKTCKRHHLAALTQVIFPPAAVSIRDRLAGVDGECHKLRHAAQSVQRFCDDDMHKNKDLKRDERI